MGCREFRSLGYRVQGEILIYRVWNKLAYIPLQSLYRYTAVFTKKPCSNFIFGLGVISVCARFYFLCCPPPCLHRPPCLHPGADTLAFLIFMPEVSPFVLFLSVISDRKQTAQNSKASTSRCRTLDIFTFVRLGAIHAESGLLIFDGPER